MKKLLKSDWLKIVIILVLILLGSLLPGCQADGKLNLLSLDWSHKVLRDGEGAAERNTGNCDKVFNWGNASK